MALVKGASVGFGAKAMAKDVGREVDISLDTDASAAKGIACRRGVGKVRHLHTPLLWVQQKVDEGLVVRKIGAIPGRTMLLIWGQSICLAQTFSGT